MEPLVATSDLEVFADGLDHPEGICVGPDGQMYAGGEAGQVYRIDGQGSVTEITTTGGFLLGLAADGDGILYLCDQQSACVWRFDPVSGHRDVFSSGDARRTMRLPNWGCFDASGNYYVSDSGNWEEANGLIWVVRADGRTEVFSEDSVDFPNGMAVGPDGDVLYVLESTPGKLVAIPINADGTAGTRKVLLDLPGVVPDGVALTADEAFVISCYRPDAVLLWSNSRGLVTVAEDVKGTVLAAPTNVVFTGPERDAMVVPNIGRWHLTRIRAGIVGAPLFLPRFP